MDVIFKKPYLEIVDYPGWEAKQVSVSVLREDTVHPFIHGNKWRKLRYNLIDFKKSGKNTILTFGGAYSNHLVATASASVEYGFKAVGIVRGENVSNPYLDYMRSCGMHLHFISRPEYRNKKELEILSKLLRDLCRENIIDDPETVFILPEGGANLAAVMGASEIMDEIPAEYDYIACACGTGATVAGLSKKTLPHQQVIGVSVLKVSGYFEKEIVRLGGSTDRVLIQSDFHFGGYAKKNAELIGFCEDFTCRTSIPIEPVYTGKLFYAIDDMIKKDYFKKGSKVTLIHTGGIFNFNKY